jgi:hypothetical protein
MYRDGSMPHCLHEDARRRSVVLPLLANPINIHVCPLVLCPLWPLSPLTPFHLQYPHYSLRFCHAALPPPHSLSSPALTLPLPLPCLLPLLCASSFAASPACAVLEND